MQSRIFTYFASYNSGCYEGGKERVNTSQFTSSPNNIIWPAWLLLIVVENFAIIPTM